MLHRLSIVLAAALLAGLLGGCKSSFYKDMNIRWTFDDDLTAEESVRKPVIGIIVRKAPIPGAKGVHVERVLRASPADAAGFRPGDVLVRLGATTTRQKADIEAFLSGASAATRPSGPAAREAMPLAAGHPAAPDAGPGATAGAGFAALVAQALGGSTRRWIPPTSRVEATVLRGGEEIVIRLDLRSQKEYAEIIDERFGAAIQNGSPRIWIPFLFDYARCEVDPETWLAYQGTRVREPVVFYRDVDLIPILGIFSLFRHESVPVVDSSRVQLLAWPLIFTSQGTYGDFRREAEEPGEDAYEGI